MKLFTRSLLIVGVAGALFFPGAIFAASDLITFSVSPRTPAPNQSVVVSIQSYAVDLNSADITWYVDKVPVKNGRGEKNVQTNTKDFGQTVVIDVIIDMPSGGRFDKQFLLKSAEVDLLWEADTSVPPFYKGKALPTYHSIVKLSAIPRANSLGSDPSAYSYVWTANQTQGIGQGLGKSNVLVTMKYSGSPVPVSVKVTNPATNESVGETTKEIVAVDPLLRFYEEAPLLGVRFDRALSGIVVTEGTGFILRAVPYFFSNDNLWTGDLVYSWKNNTARLATGIDPNILMLEKQNGVAAGNTVTLSLQNRKRILQQATAGATINFSPAQ